MNGATSTICAWPLTVACVEPICNETLRPVTGRVDHAVVVDNAGPQALEDAAEPLKTSTRALNWRLLKLHLRTVDHNRDGVLSNSRRGERKYRAEREAMRRKRRAARRCGGVMFHARIVPLISLTFNIHEYPD